tara:strand:+ start:1177 stop:1587 length:411 start_codon:yes stop_codon:yes gene_type:complete
MARPYLGGSTAGIKAVSGDVTLQPADSGKKIVVDASAALNFTITLPATASNKGIEYDIVLGVASNAASEVLVTSDTNIVGGLILNGTGAVTAITSGATRGFGDASDAGSRMHIVCDGSKWIILNANSDVAFVTAFS